MHRITGGRADQLPLMQQPQEPHHLISRRARQSELAAAFGIQGGLAAIDLGMQAGVGKPQPTHGVGRRSQTNPVEQQVGGGVVGKGNHQPHCVPHCQPGPRTEMRRQNARPGNLVFVPQFEKLPQVELSLVALAIHLDHHRKLDEAGRGHRHGRAVGKPLAGRQMLDRHRQLAIMIFNKSHQPPFQRLSADRLDQREHPSDSRHQPQNAQLLNRHGRLNPENVASETKNSGLTLRNPSRAGRSVAEVHTDCGVGWKNVPVSGPNTADSGLPFHDEWPSPGPVGVSGRIGPARPLGHPGARDGTGCDRGFPRPGSRCRSVGPGFDWSRFRLVPVSIGPGFDWSFSPLF